MGCPNCGSTALTIGQAIKARQIGEFSLAGGQMKISARLVAVAECSDCDLYVTGHLENAELAPDGMSFVGGHFVPDPTSE
jgi:hypothetical protein